MKGIVPAMAQTAAKVTVPAMAGHDRSVAAHHPTGNRKAMPTIRPKAVHVDPLQKTSTA
jgi:hypothetical protein